MDREALIAMAKAAISTEARGEEHAIDARWNLGRAAAEWAAAGLSDGQLAREVSKSRALIQQARAVWELFHSAPTRGRISYRHHVVAMQSGATTEELEKALSRGWSADKFRRELSASLSRDLEAEVSKLLLRVRRKFAAVEPRHRVAIAKRLASAETALRLRIEADH